MPKNKPDAEIGKIWLTIDDCGTFEWIENKALALAKRDRIREPIRANGDTGRILGRTDANTFEFDKSQLGPNDFKDPPLGKGKMLSRYRRKAPK